MMLFTLIILLATFHSSKSDCDDKRTLYELWEGKLHKDLMKIDRIWETTPNGCDVTEVYIRITMKSFDMDSSNDLFTMYSWTTMNWTDKRLAWDPDKYGGLNQTFFWSHNYWHPIIENNNRHEEYYLADSYFMQCKLQSAGRVVCVTKKSETAACGTALGDWPYDAQQCSLEYGVAEMQKKVHLISKYKRAVTMLGADYGPKWTIVDYKQENNVSATTQLKITFILERNGESLAALVIIPMIILSILTTSSFFLDVNDRNRFVIAIFAVTCHLFLLQQLGFIIPKHDDKPPRIVKLFHKSIVMSVLFVILTVVLSKLRDRKTVPPYWILKAHEIVFDSSGKHFIWPNWEIGSTDEKNVQIWVGFTNIINSVGLFSTVFAYAIMLAVLVPTRPPFN